MEKFANLQYVRPDFAELEKLVLAYIEGLKNAKSYEEMKGLYLEQAQKESEVATMISIASIRNTVNTNDEFYAGEMSFINENMPKIGILQKQAEKIIVESPYVEDFRNELKEKAQEMRRNFEQQRDEFIDGVAQMEEYLEMLDLIDKLTKKNEKLHEAWEKEIQVVLETIYRLEQMKKGE